MLLAVIFLFLEAGDSNSPSIQCQIDLAKLGIFSPTDAAKTDLGFVITGPGAIAHINHTGNVIAFFEDDSQGPYGMVRPKVVGSTGGMITVIGRHGQFITFDYGLTPLSNEIPALPEGYRQAIWSAVKKGRTLEATTYEPKRKPLSVIFELNENAWAIQEATPDRPPVDLKNHHGDLVEEGARKTKLWFAGRLVLFEPGPYKLSVYEGLPGLSKLRLELTASTITQATFHGLSYAIEGYGLLGSRYVVALQGVEADGTRLRFLDLFDSSGHHVDRIEKDPDQRILVSNNSMHAWIVTGAEAEQMVPLQAWLDAR